VTIKFFFQKVWNKLKYPLGYFLFITAIGYGFFNIPADLWNIKPLWLLLAIINILIIFLCQLLQVVVFLYAHSLKPDFLYISLFTLRKGILNSVMPAKSGTLILAHMLSNHYQLRWHNFLIFTITGGIASVFVSLLGAVWLFWGLLTLSLVSFFFLLIVIFLSRIKMIPYAQTLPTQLTIMLIQFLTILIGFFCILHGIGFNVSFQKSAHFAVVLNLLSQVSITPGNLGIREIVTGAVASLVELPTSVGILAGALFFAIRLIVYTLLLCIFEIWNRC